jgi:hypothetical protein
VTLSRRRFLQSASAALMLSAAGLPSAVRAGMPLPPGKFLIAGFGSPYDEHGLAAVNLGNARMRRMSLPFMPHCFVQNPPHPERVWAIERRVYADKPYMPPSARRPASAVEVDLGKMEILQKVRLNDTSEFFGHGFFTPDGKALFISRVDMEKGVGHLTGYDAADCSRIVADCEVTAGAIHETRILPDGTALVVGSGVKPAPGMRPFSGPRVKKGALIHYDLAAGRILKEWTVEADDQLAGHCRVLKDGTLLVVSRPRQDENVPGKVHYGHWDGTALTAIPYTQAIPAGEPGECLTIAISEDERTTLITNPQNHRILVVDARTGTFKDQIRQTVSGLVFDAERDLFIGSGDTLLLLDGAGKELHTEMSARFAQTHGPYASAHSLLI